MAESASRVGHAPRAHEAAGVVAFWAFFAVLAAATRLLDPRVPNQDPRVAEALVSLAAVEYAAWAIVTLVLLWLTSRFSIEGGERWGRLLLFVVLGVVVAIGVDAMLTAVRAELLDFVPRRPRRGRRGGGPPMGVRLGGAQPFGFLDDLMVYFAVLFGGIARDYFLRYRARQADAIRLEAQSARLEAELARAKLDALQAQLNPHFLFNTLNAVSSLVERDPRGVRRMIARLAELLRHTLGSDSAQEIPLRRELDLARRYVDIMQVRFQGALQVTFDVEPDLEGALVPQFVLQPLVENAIKHGGGGEGRPAVITVRAVERGGTLFLRVEDDGAAPDERDDDVVPREGGVGLANTRERLRQLYGDAARLTLAPRPQRGTAAEVALPLRRATA